MPHFRAAKSELESFYATQPERRTFYCGCTWSEEGVDHKSCGYVPLRDNARSSRIEYEHIVPASFFGHAFSEWTEGHPSCLRSNGKPFKGRDCARRMSPLFEHIEADIYNLVPAIGEVNGRRSNYPMGIIEGEARAFGACDVEIEGKRIEPSESVRGDIARTYFYMAWAYPRQVVLSTKEREMFDDWSRDDPVDEVEIARARAIKALQGNTNPFVSPE